MIYKSLKVLLVEDMPVIAKVTEQMLKKAVSNRYTSTHKTRLADTLAALRTEDFDCILLDLNLPDSRELETVSRVVEAAPEVPIIVLTASNDDDLGLKAVQKGAQDFLLKGDFNYMTLDRAIVFAVERHRLQRTIRQLAVIDELTGLYNRRGFNTLHPDILQKVASSDARGFLCFFDLDRFKLINDELGHAAGDDALKEFSTNLQSVFRKDTLLCRLGGDEFVAMGAETSADQAEGSLHSLEIVLSVRNTNHVSKFPLESSWGLVHFQRGDPLDITELSGLADAALYRAKERRRRPGSRGPTPPPAPMLAPGPAKNRVLTAPADDPGLAMARHLRLACEAHEPDICGHLDNVARYTRHIAERMGLPPAAILHLFHAAPLHDIGKIAVPNELLSKPGRLTADEMAIVKTHTTHGHRILSGCRWPVIQCAANIALTHHEAWDGSGYPRGLAGTAIPLEGRILAVADVYDALLSQRAYKSAWTEAQVLAELRRLRGTKFDPEVVDLFLSELPAPLPAATPSQAA